MQMGQPDRKSTVLQTVTESFGSLSSGLANLLAAFVSEDGRPHSRKENLARAYRDAGIDITAKQQRRNVGLGQDGQETAHTWQAAGEYMPSAATNLGK